MWRYALLIVIGLAVLQCTANSSPLASETLFSVKPQGHLVIVLSLPGRHDTTSMNWITRLTFPVQTWTRFEKEQVEKLKHLTESDTRVTVIIPVSTKDQRKYILKSLGSEIIYLSLVRLLFVLAPGEVLPYQDYPEISCALISLNTTVIDVPKIDFWNCTERSATSTHRLFAAKRSRLWTSLRNRSFVAGAYVKRTSGETISDTHKDSYSVTLMRCLQNLNVSLLLQAFTAENSSCDYSIQGILEKKIDISLLRSAVDEKRSCLVYVGSVIEDTSLNFYSAHGRVRSSFSSFWQFIT